MILTTLLILQSPNFHTIINRKSIRGSWPCLQCACQLRKKSRLFSKKIEGRVRFVETGYRFTAKRVLCCLANRMAQIMAWSNVTLLLVVYNVVRLRAKFHLDRFIVSPVRRENLQILLDCQIQHFVVAPPKDKVIDCGCTTTNLPLSNYTK